MKQPVLLLAIALLLAACGGGSSESNEMKWKEGDLCAILFLGYGKDFSAISEMSDFKKYCEKFPSLREITKFTAETEGDEVFYIIPRYDDATVTISEYKIDIENMEETIGNELYRGNNSPVLIRCNFSDIIPNTSVTVTGNGSSVTFNPAGGVEAGKVQFVGSGGLSERMEETLPAGIELEYYYKGISAGIHATVNNGNVSITFDREEAVAILGETDFMLEDNYNVEGLSGTCKGVFIGDVGQDYNPVLCCLLEDGGIEVLALYDALREYDFRTSGRLRGYDNVVSVSNEGVHGDEGEGGGYATLFTLDATGNKKEVDFNALLNGEWIHQIQGENGEERYIIYLSMDWKIKYISGFVNSEAHEIFLGTCRIIEESETAVVYEYEMKEGDRSVMTGEAPDPTVRTGTFKVQQITDDWVDGIEITCMTGLKFHPGGLGQAAVFKNKYRMNN